MRLFSRLTIVYFFLLLLVAGCSNNMSPAFKVGDRVKVTCNQKEYLGVITENWFNPNRTFSYRVYCNDLVSWYSEENLEIVDPMPTNLEEASWHNENKMKQKTQKIETSQTPPKDN